jgi:hypothetical protein
MKSTKPSSLKAALSAAVLAAVILFTAACANPLLPKPEESEAAPGQGIVKVTLAGAEETNVRTLMPVTDPITYTLTFTQAGKEVTRTMSGAAAQYELDPGTWNLRVEGMLLVEGEAEGTLIVTGETTVTVTVGTSTPVTVNLEKAYDDADGYGGPTASLRYSVTFPDTVEEALLYLYAIPHDPELQRIIDITTEKEGHITEVYSGYYRVAVSLSYTDSGVKKTAGKTEVAHFFPKLETRVAYAFTEEDFIGPRPMSLVNTVWAGKTPRAGDWLTISFKDIETAIAGSTEAGLRTIWSFSFDNSTNNWGYTFDGTARTGTITSGGWNPAPDGFTVSEDGTTLTITNYGSHTGGPREFKRLWDSAGTVTITPLAIAAPAHLVGSVWAGTTPQDNGNGWLTISFKDLTTAINGSAEIGLRTIWSFNADNTTNNWGYTYDGTARTGTIASSGWNPAPNGFSVSADGTTLTITNYGNHSGSPREFKRLRAPDPVMALVESHQISGTISRAAYNGTTYVVAGGVYNNNASEWSDDGVSWTKIDAGTGEGTSQFPASSAIRSLVFANGIFVAGGDGSTIAWSNDGKTWTKATTNLSQANTRIGAIVWTETQFVAATGEGVITSADGKIWSAPVANSPTSNTGIASNGSRTVVIGSGNISWSDNLTTWTTKPIAELISGASMMMMGGITCGNGVFVTVGYASNRIIWSEDGETWQAADFTDPAHDAGNFYSVTYGNGMFIAVANAGRMLLSLNGKTWTEFHNGANGNPIGSPFDTSPINSISYGFGKFIALGNDGKIAISE